MHDKNILFLTFFIEILFAFIGYLQLIYLMLYFRAEYNAINLCFDWKVKLISMFNQSYGLNVRLILMFLNIFPKMSISIINDFMCNENLNDCII